MSAVPVKRPVVRSFVGKFAANAARWVRSGGHAVVWETPSKARLVLPVPDDDDPMDLAQWSLLDLGKSRFTRAKTGPFRGLATIVVPNDCHDIVRRRAERDSIHEGPFHTVRLDCLACGACCKDNRVLLFEDDIERFAEGGRLDLTKPPYARRKDGKLYLTLNKKKACHHLGKDNKCAIYPLRPDACSQFPMASECCLYAREEELGITDGLPRDAA
jgi:Fe-S-cluster containining protein